MTLDLTAILVLGLAAVIYAAVIPGRWRAWAVLLGSIVALFWLQTPLTPRYADFLLPSATVALSVAGWWLSRPPRRAFMAPASPATGDPGTAQLDDNNIEVPRVYVRDDWFTLIVVITVILALSLFRYTGTDFRLTASRPPSPVFVGITALEVGLVFTALAIILRRLPQRIVLNGAMAAMIALFVVVKWAPATAAVAGDHLTTTNNAIIAAIAPLRTTRCGSRRKIIASAVKTRPTSRAVMPTKTGEGGREAVRRKSAPA